MSGYQRVNYYELCRLCTTNEGEKIPIFYGEGLKKEIQIKLGLLSIQVSEEDTLPNYVCRACLDKMEKCLDFRNICFTAAYALDNYATSLQNNEDFKKDGTVYVKNNIELPNLHLVKLSDGTFHSFNSSTVVHNSFSDPVIDISKSDDESILTNWKPEEVIVKEDSPIKIDDSDVELVEVDVDEHETKTSSETESCTSDSIEILSSNPKKFKKRNSLILREKSHKKEYKCDICSKKFTFNCRLIKHKKLHASSNPHVCEYCGKEFTINAYYLLHKQMHIKKGLTDLDLPFKCPTCYKLFGRKYLLDDHLNEHVVLVDEPVHLVLSDKPVAKSKTKIDQDPLEFDLPKISSSSETTNTRVLRPIRNREKRLNLN